MRVKFLKGLARLISGHPYRTGLILLVVTGLFAALASRLTLEMNFTSLMPKDDPMVIEFDQIMKEFDGAASMLVVAEGRPEKLVEFARRAAPEIEALTDYVKKVDYRIPRELLRDHALMLMKTADLNNSRGVFEDPNLTGFLTNLNNSLEREYTGSGGGSIEGQEQEQGALQFMDGLQTFTAILDSSLHGYGSGMGQRASEAILFGDTYYRSWDREMLIMQVIPTFDFMDMEMDTAATNRTEAIVKRIAGELGIQAGLTGSVPLARDEMVAVEEDSFLITSLAMVGILVLFVFAFRMVISPVLAMITLAVGVLWALGLSQVLVGALNMMTAMMGVILVGLGIDFSIHIIAMYSEMRKAGKNAEESLLITMQKSGLGILTGGLTTSAAFFTMMATRSRGYQEFGLTLGTGIIMTMAAALTVLPTLLILHEKFQSRIRKKLVRRPPSDISYRRLGKGAAWLARHPFGSLAVLVALVVGLGYRAAAITWDYNYLNMEPKGLETILLQDKLIDKLNISADYAYFTSTTLEEADRLTTAARQMKTSGLVRSIVDYLPVDADQSARSDIVRDIQKTLRQARIKPVFTPTDLELLRDEFTRLEMNIIEIQEMANIGNQKSVYLKTGILVGVIPDEEDPTIHAWQEELNRVTDNISSGVLSEFVRKLEQMSAADLAGLDLFRREFAANFMATAQRMANPEPLSIETLPESIRRQYVGRTGDLFLITIFPRQNVWDSLFLERFTNELYDISPRATGMPPVYFRLVKIFSRDGKFTTLLALAVIFLILLLDFRRLRRTVLALVPLVIGAVWMVGVMEVSGLQLTMLNVIAIPLIIGIGIDDGVHILHRYQIEGRYQHEKVFASTGRAILLTSLTTMLGFGSLVFASYRGLGSMGSALFIGVGTCFLASVLVLPAIFGVIEKTRKPKAP